MSNLVLEALHSDPWAEDFIDLPTLNARAGEAIEESIKEVRSVARGAPRTLRSTSIVVLGPPGAGKTHLFSRLRRHLGPRAIFVHVRPLVHAPMTPRFVLGEVVRQLGYATHGLLQLDALVGSLFAHLSGVATSFPTTFLSEHQQLPETERELRLDEAVEKILALFPEIDDAYLRRLLQAPFATGTTQRALLAWLSGRDCDVAQLSRIGATASLSEDLAMPALRTLCAVAALGAPIVLVMDQLENLIEGSEPGPRLVGYANLAAELVDAMRGLVLVHMALDTEWSRGIEPALNLSQRSRLLMRSETLALPTERQREDLLRLWIERLPVKQAPYPWPFTDERLARVLRAPGTTPRMLLVECRQALTDGGDGEPESVATAENESKTVDGLMAEWEARIGSARHVLAEADEQRACVDASRVADGLLACGRFLQGARISTSTGAGPAQLLVESAGEKAHLCLLHHGHHRSLSAALNRLTELGARAPVIAVRERSRELPPTWKDTLARRNALLASGRARWIWLEPDDVVRLLALDALLQGARSGDVTNNRGEPVDVALVVDWVQMTLDVPEWGIVRALLETVRSEAAEEALEESPVDAHTSGSGLDSGSPGCGVAMAVLRQLRIASLERVVREASRIDPSVTRATVLADLEAGEGVRFFGRSIVCVRSLA